MVIPNYKILSMNPKLRNIYKTQVLTRSERYKRSFFAFCFLPCSLTVLLIPSTSSINYFINVRLFFFLSFFFFAFSSFVLFFFFFSPLFFSFISCIVSHFRCNSVLIFTLSQQKRGLDDTKLLPYFPFRDDGYQILRVIEDMVEDYVNL